MPLFFRHISSSAASAPSIIVLHGLLGSSDNWLTHAKQLADVAEFYLIDQRNHGQSFHNNSHTYTDLANDIFDFIKENNLKNPILLGHSMGGKAAIMTHSKYKNLIKSLIIIDIAIKKYSPDYHQNLLHFLLSMDLKVIESRQKANDFLSKIEPSEGARQFLLKNLYRNSEGFWEWKPNLEALLQNISAIVDSVPITEFSIPTLVLKGEQSTYITAEDEKKYKDSFSNLTFHSVPNANHWVQADNPVDTQYFIRKFIQENEN